MVAEQNDGENSGEGDEKASAGDAGAPSLLVGVTGVRAGADDDGHLTATLTRVAELAVQAVPGADGAGLTLIHQGRPDTMVATSSFVRDVDAVQYGFGQGPCIEATISGLTVRSDSLGGDKRWPRFGSAVARMNVHSSLSLPLHTADGVVGSMNIYAHAKRSFDDRSVELGEVFSVSAAVAVQSAQMIAESRRVTAQLQDALVGRAVIDQAIGILMSRSGSSADEAFARLRTLSQSQHRKVSVVAKELVEQAVRRARSRPSSS